MNKSRIFIPELDGLRFVAFLLVFIHHSSSHNYIILDSVKKIGWLGIEIFFCLSAFLLTRLLLFEKQKMGSIDIFNFIVRRALRIWPLYVIFIVVAILFSYYHGRITEEVWYRVLGLLTFTDNLFAAIKGFNPILFTGHLWTISYEEQFYLVLPFFVTTLVSLNLKSRIYFCLNIFIVGCVIRYLTIYYSLNDPFIWTVPVTHFESILLGIIIAFYEQGVTAINKKLIMICFFISLIGIFLLPETNIISYHLLFTYPLAGIFSGCVLCYVLNNDGGFVQKLVSAKIVRFAGKISFGLYVFHTFCMQFVDYMLGISSPLLNLVISFFLIFSVASLSYLFWERRFLLMKRKFTIIPSRPV